MARRFQEDRVSEVKDFVQGIAVGKREMEKDAAPREGRQEQKPSPSAVGLQGSPSQPPLESRRFRQSSVPALLLKQSLCADAVIAGKAITVLPTRSRRG